LTWNIFPIGRKGSTDDVLADLVPALIITVIAAFLLMNFASERKELVNKGIDDARIQLLESTDFLNYLRSRTNLEGGLCSIDRLTTADIMSKNDPNCKDPLIRMTEHFNKDYMPIGTCLSVNIYDPEEDSSVLLTPACINMEINPVNSVFLPVKGGNHVEVNISRGITHKL